jgi:predicted pyridoxine 5'-phosphate oxidase superfamily flavin-nucleotide-binding protein
VATPVYPSDVAFTGAVKAQQTRMGSLKPEGYKARVERVMLIKIAAWDVNCPQHIPQKIDAEDVRVAIETRDARIAELEAELKKLRG